MSTKTRPCPSDIMQNITVPAAWHFNLTAIASYVCHAVSVPEEQPEQGMISSISNHAAQVTFETVASGWHLSDANHRAKHGKQQLRR